MDLVESRADLGAIGDSTGFRWTSLIIQALRERDLCIGELGRVLLS